MNKHAPGPWRVRVDEYGYQVPQAIEDANGRAIAALPWTIRNGHEAEAKANTRLIAAAPELLEACKAAFKFSQSSHDADADVELLLARAIAKAEDRDADQ